MEQVHVYYDGGCGLCNRSVNWLKRKDDRGQFDYAPLDSEKFEELAGRTNQKFPDSMVVETADARILTRSAGVIHLLKRLGGVWKAVGWLMWVVPRPLRDAVYDLIARFRHRLFPGPDSCPIGAPRG